MLTKFERIRTHIALFISELALNYIAPANYRQWLQGIIAKGLEVEEFTHLQEEVSHA